MIPLRTRWRDRRAAVSIMFAVALIGLLTAFGAAINIGQLADERAALQRTADNAALSGAAAYSQNAASFKALGLQVATNVFCNQIPVLPAAATIVAQPGAQSCGSGPGPNVSAVTDSYVVGTPGLTSGHCGTYLPPAPYICGFIVTVSATATFPNLFTPIFGNTTTVSVHAMAANPFLNFAQIFSLPSGVKSTAKYANSIWVYPVAVTSGGSIDYSSSAGALPDTSACTGDPDQVTCGSYVMLASTMYAGKGSNYTVTVNGVTTTYDNGVVVNPSTPTQITATTPLGIAFRSIAGGNYVQYSPPGVYGYQVTNLGANPPNYAYAPNGCIYPYYNLAYGTVGQTWATVKTTANGTTTTSYTPNLPWPLVTHWFYSSFLSNGLPPSQGEITAQAAGAQSIPSVPMDAAQNGGNILGNPTYNPSPNPAVPATCASGANNNTSQSTSFPASGSTNCSLYIAASTSPTVASAASGSCYTPAATPGQQYATLSCQNYGNNYYTFYWNDMGGAASDDKNYGDGIVQIACTGSGFHVMLIQ